MDLPEFSCTTLSGWCYGANLGESRYLMAIVDDSVGWRCALVGRLSNDGAPLPFC